MHGDGVYSTAVSRSDSPKPRLYYRDPSLF
jgi:hypothetical protein